MTDNDDPLEYFTGKVHINSSYKISFTGVKHVKSMCLHQTEMQVWHRQQINPDLSHLIEITNV